MARGRSLEDLLADVRDRADLPAATGIDDRFSDARLTRYINQAIQQYRRLVTECGQPHYLKGYLVNTSTSATEDDQGFAPRDYLVLPDDLYHLKGIDIRRGESTYTMQDFDEAERNGFREAPSWWTGNRTGMPAFFRLGGAVENVLSSLTTAEYDNSPFAGEPPVQIQIEVDTTSWMTPGQNIRVDNQVVGEGHSQDFYAVVSVDGQTLVTLTESADYGTPNAASIYDAGALVTDEFGNVGEGLQHIVRVIPSADAVYTCRILYLPVATDLVNPSDEFDGIAGYEEWVVYRAAMDALARDTLQPAYQMCAAELQRLERRMTFEFASSAGAGRRVDTAAARGRIGAMARRWW